MSPRRPAASSWDLGEGDEVLPGRSVLAKLGGGHHYEAFLVWDGHLRTTAVAKLIRPNRVGDAATLGGLVAEAEALAALDHPVIVRSFGAVSGGERPQLLLEHLEGPRLSSLIRRFGPLGREQLAPLAIQLAAAIHYMHAEGWVHLDIKPANVIMGAPPRLIDLSVARRVAAAASVDQPIGTDSYMAPEQCLPGDLGPVGPAADVFGLGVTLYRAATGERPFKRGDDRADRPEERWPQLITPPLPLDADLPPAAIAVIEASLAAEPAARPAPAAIGDAFEEVLGALPRSPLSRIKPRWG